MTKNIVLLLVGILIGAVAMRSYDASSGSQVSERAQQQSLSLPGASEDSLVEATQQLDLQNAVIVQTENPAPQQIVAAERSVAENLIENTTTPNRVETQTENRSQPSVTEDTGLPPLLPEEYHFMLEPPANRQITFEERVLDFAAEARDESWAYTMELGINQHMAVATPVGTVVEYVECRATACMMAGYVQPGFENGSGALIDEMRGTGWWQLDGGTMSRSRGQNGENRFVNFMTREQAGEAETVPVEPQQAEIESTTQDETASSERA